MLRAKKDRNNEEWHVTEPQSNSCQMGQRLRDEWQEMKTAYSIDNLREEIDSMDLGEENRCADCDWE